MKNHLRLAAKRLIKSAADHHRITPLQLIGFHNTIIHDRHSITDFASVLGMCVDPVQRNHIDKYLADGTRELDVVRVDLTQPYIDQCTYLFHTISNFYNNNVQDFAGLEFYPKLEHLFDKPDQPLEAKPKTPEKPSDADDFGTASPENKATALKVLNWNKQQREAFAQVHAWLRTNRTNRAQVYRLFGWAGTGKTEMSKAIADFVINEAGKNNVPNGSVLFAAYTGKAASVMRSKGCRGADTLHSLLYKPLVDPETGLCKEFVLNQESPLREAALLIIDEGSMVNDEMAKDIMSFGCPILVLGDPAQLPPVKGEGYFTDAEPDVMLTSIERQAAENPIIWLATRARKGLDIKPGKYGDSMVYAMGTHVSDEMYDEADQVLCGLNATRRTINKRARRINGKASKNPIYPVKGDRLVCLRNNRLSGLYNGTIWTSSAPVIQRVMKPIFKGSKVLRAGDVDVLTFKVRSNDELDDSGKPYIVQTQCSLHLFNNNLPEPDYKSIAGTDSFDFGYGLSVHRAQGSQWDSVLLFDESSTFREHCHKHRYTGITRAASRVTIVL